MRYIELSTLTLCGLLFAMTPEVGVAQRRGPERGHSGGPTLTLEAHTGFSTFSRFLEAHVLTGNNVFPRGQRSVEADPAFVLGGSVGAWIWDGTAVQLGYTWATTEFDYVDTSGLDRHLLDRDGLNDLNTHLIGLEFIQMIFDPARTISPYLSAGINGEFWVLGERRRADAIVATKRTLFRWGGSAGIGLQLRLSRPVALRLDATRYILGNPFRGRTAFIPESGLTFDKPDYVTMPRYTLGIVYTLSRE